jgi:hypothetical protein
MNDWKRYLDGLHPHLLAWIWAALLLVQAGLALEVTCRRAIGKRRDTN